MTGQADLVIADGALEAVLAIRSKSDLSKVRRRLETLALAPEMGTVYDPVHGAARPDHEVLVTYAGHYGIYYTYDAGAARVEVEYVCDERRDPARRFGEPWGDVGDVG